LERAAFSGALYNTFDWYARRMLLDAWDEKIKMNVTQLRHDCSQGANHLQRAGNGILKEHTVRLLGYSIDNESWNVVGLSPSDNMRLLFDCI
jgi:hypothetical protein